MDSFRNLWRNALITRSKTQADLSRSIHEAFTYGDCHRNRAKVTLDSDEWEEYGNTLARVFEKNASANWDQCAGLLVEDDLIEFMTVYDDKEVDNDEVEIQLLTTDLVCESLEFDASMEQQFLMHDPDIDHASST
ncbi:hypothetical protein TNCV_200341 [Trichonephila clavipes]|nr:hypothetical protein TNCV_200341 [Trichonephila clavipes]